MKLKIKENVGFNNKSSMERDCRIPAVQQVHVEIWCDGLSEKNHQENRMCPTQEIHAEEAISS